YAGDVQGSRAGVGERNGLSGAGGVQILIAESQCGRGETDASGYTGAGEGHGLWASGGVVGNGDRTGLAAGSGGGESDADGAVGASGDGSAAGVGLAVLRAGRDAGDVQGSRAGVGERNGLRGAGGVQILIAEGQCGGREADAGGDTGAGERYGLWASGGVVGDGDRAGLAAGGGGCEGDADGAVGAGGDGSAAGVGLAVLRAGRDAGDVQGSRAGVGERNGLRGAGGIQILIAEGQCGRGETDASGYTGAGEGHGLRASGSVVGDGNRAGLAAGGGGGEGDADGAVGASGDGSAASVGLGVLRAGYDAGDVQGSRAGVGERNGLRGAGGIQILIAEGQCGRRETDASGYTGAGEGHGLWASGSVVGDRDRAGLAAGSGGSKGDADGAVGASGDGSAASVGLGVLSAGYDAGDVQGSRAGVGERNGLRGAGGIQILITEGQRGGCEGDSWSDTGAREIDQLRAPGGVIGNGDRAGLAARRGGGESDADGAVGASGDGSAAGVGLAVLRAGRDAGDVQGSRAGVGERNGLRCAGGVQILIAEGQRGGREADASGDTGGGEGYGLWASGGVVGEGDRAGLAAGGGGCEGDADGAVGAGGDGSAAGVGLAVLRAGRDAGDVQGSRAGVGERNGLRGAGGIQILIAEGQCGRGETDASGYTGAGEGHG